MVTRSEWMASGGEGGEGGGRFFPLRPVDPTKLTGDQIVKEVQRVVKGLLGYGARMPKELMLYVKNLVSSTVPSPASPPTSTSSPRPDPAEDAGSVGTPQWDSVAHRDTMREGCDAMAP
jgi:hypothetical protein